MTGFQQSRADDKWCILDSSERMSVTLQRERIEVVRFPVLRSHLRRLLAKVAFVAVVLAVLISAVMWGQMKPSTVRACVPSQGRSAILPGLMLWAWERPEDLRFIDTRTVGVAFLSETCCLRGERVMVRPRMQPLSVPPGTVLEAVVRIEGDRNEHPVLSAGQMAEVLRIVNRVARGPGVKAVQIDFDARESQRAFYSELLRELRLMLPDSMPLSITALASWCMYDSWISGLPVDEVVPMMFRMGADHDRIRSVLGKRNRFVFSGCGQSVGISVDEPEFRVPSGRRIYAFNPRSWSKKTFQSIIEREGW